jgi:hypothetical protein
LCDGCAFGANGYNGKWSSVVLEGFGSVESRREVMGDKGGKKDKDKMKKQDKAKQEQKAKKKQESQPKKP